MRNDIPLHKCKIDYCDRMTRGYTCERHGDQEKRPSAKERGYLSKEWKEAREQQLNDEPLCEECLLKGTIVSATHVDHIDGSGPKGNNRSENLRSYCKPCHSRKTIRHDQDILGRK